MRRDPSAQAPSNKPSPSEDSKSLEGPLSEARGMSVLVAWCECQASPAVAPGNLGGLPYPETWHSRLNPCPSRTTAHLLDMYNWAKPQQLCYQLPELITVKCYISFWKSSLGIENRDDTTTLIMPCVKHGHNQVRFFVSLVWLDLGLNSTRPGHGRTFYPQGQCAGGGII